MLNGRSSDGLDDVWDIARFIKWRIRKDLRLTDVRRGLEWGLDILNGWLGPQKIQKGLQKQ